MPNSLLVINADGPETRVALVENGLLGELYIERKQERGSAGNIYKGRGERVLPAPPPLARASARANRPAPHPHNPGAGEAPPATPGGARIEDLLKEGQEII